MASAKHTKKVIVDVVHANFFLGGKRRRRSRLKKKRKKERNIVLQKASQTLLI